MANTEMKAAACAVGCDARDAYSEGRNCAEAIIATAGHHLDRDGLPDTLGAGFTGGIGHSGCVCGALAGGVTLLGEHAKTAGLSPVATRSLAEELSSDLHKRFTAEFGSACCRVIKRGQTEGSDEWMSGCAGLTEWTASTVTDLITDTSRTTGRARLDGLDVASAVRRGATGVLGGGAVALLLGTLAPVHGALVFPLTVVVLAVLACALEFGGPARRRIGRLLRAVGAGAAALLLVAAAVAPGSLINGIGALLTSPGWMMAIARMLLAVAALAASGLALYRFKRYR